MVTKKEYEELVAGLRLMDDDFMCHVFDGNIPATQYLLDILLEHRPLQVKRVTTQRELRSAGGRSIRLDIFAEDAEGRKYDIEIQRRDAGAVPKRARYYSSLMDTKLLKKNEDFELLPETYVIFITENDVSGTGLPILHFDRTADETGELLGDGAHILYVNGAYHNENDEIGRLMHDFRCRKSAEMHESPLKERTRYLKEAGEEDNSMCKAVEDLIKREATLAKAEGKAEGIAEGIAKGQAKGKAEGALLATLENAKAILKAGLATPEQVAEALNLPLGKVKELAKEI